MRGQSTKAAAVSIPGNVGSGCFVLSQEQEKVIKHRGGHLQVAKSISPRLPKTMNTYRPASEPEVHCWAAETAEDEAEVVADTIERLVKKGFR